MFLLRPERAGGGGRGTEPLREAGVVEPSAEAWDGGGCASEWVFIPRQPEFSHGSNPGENFKGKPGPV